ncbi:MAG: di-trans,poly-cis-decaprenylcistransferase [Zetaproteobacteria bacterium CG12_big_fil_rev_8_21_14_0_65_54_13]|nr:MAG: di-trans,poly-cis-decaprenylcistransferase [Zetaproteobacteria bacterium CG23_combo_of_CG06-09_8_20_14_all_54_7]PIW45291.1 MAG: di-trans,poly-cis-decaprenylcistransferase [Zetaproteobacteria bacterium CG12_big_fil_rev_8_21_14_0_65_54_13]PIX55831.1 MAG: di-trans,poly-cis-decaprenylcistransferase [Zetaproteobacteria bacterium CG_4_10_14_3_um_filter_54_28]PJA29981.1 MAG: di-trans,poly-cis-decaprenylcistransferase [Zetaproteobacteria bacterium CG_4_9_14_3_um_filter_54_145]
MADFTPMGKPVLPTHVGIIMDGNGRWAKAQGSVRLEGHQKGAEVARDVVKWAKDLGIRQLSLYAFSTENWDRPKLEVRGLMSLLAMMLPRSLPDMQQNDIRFRVLGDIAPLPGSARRAVEKACAETATNTGLDLILCLNYGGQQEILAAVKHAARWAMQQPDYDQALDSLNPELFRAMMWRHDVAPLDLMIRTGGEKRISNFHLWDAAYAELYFTDVLWPAFCKQDLQAALLEYAGRERRFGRTSEQVL